MEEAQERGMHLVIKAYGEIVRQYQDTDHKRFMKVSKMIIESHLDNDCLQGAKEVKNVTFHIYTN